MIAAGFRGAARDHSRGVSIMTNILQPQGGTDELFVEAMARMSVRSHPPLATGVRRMWGMGVVGRVRWNHSASSICAAAQKLGLDAQAVRLKPGALAQLKEVEDGGKKSLTLLHFVGNTFAILERVDKGHFYIWD